MEFHPRLHGVQYSIWGGEEIVRTIRRPQVVFSCLLLAACQMRTSSRITRSLCLDSCCQLAEHRPCLNGPCTPDASTALP